MKEETKKTNVFSGIRPTGALHLGNYLGALKGYLQLQERNDLNCIYAVVDLHGITSPYRPETYSQNVWEVALEYLACGLDPKKAHLIIQSYIPEHVELAYLLGTIYPVSRLEQLPTYKDKKKEQPHYVNMGLLYYPILMAADILLYKAQLVPVGKDQLPHLEVTREIARSFNRHFGKTFPEPQPYLTSAPLVPSLTTEGKMSKSRPGSYISLLDDENTIQKKIAKIPTDIGRGKSIPQTGGVATLLQLVEILEGKEKRKFYEKMYLGKGISYQSLKRELAAAIIKLLRPIQEKRDYYQHHPQVVRNILKEGVKYARPLAQKTLREVKEKMGLKYSF